LADSWHKTDQQYISPSAALVLISEATSILNKQPDFPDAKSYRNRISFLEAIAHRLNDKEEAIEARLRDQFEKPWISDLWCVEAADGKRYYSKSKVENSDKPFISIRYLSDFDLSEKSASIRTENLKVGIAPQSQLASKAEKILSHFQNNTPEALWEPNFIELIGGDLQRQQN
jgi:hypothetical protein